jgi:hypothetical protein
MGKPLAPLFIGARWYESGPAALTQIEQAKKSPPSFDGGLSSFLYAPPIRRSRTAKNSSGETPARNAQA